jgi:hypothetical protein
MKLCVYNWVLGFGVLGFGGLNFNPKEKGKGYERSKTYQNTSLSM